MKAITEPDRTRSGVVFDTALAIGLAIFGVVGTYFASQQHQPLRRPFDAAAAALVVFAALALIARRRYPVVVLGVVFGTTLLYFVIGYHDGPIWFPLIVAYTTAAVRGHRLAAAIVGVSGFLLFPWLDFLLRDGPAPSLIGAAWRSPRGSSCCSARPRSSGSGASASPRRRGWKRRSRCGAPVRSGSGSRASSTTRLGITCR